MIKPSFFKLPALFALSYCLSFIVLDVILQLVTRTSNIDNFIMIQNYLTNTILYHCSRTTVYFLIASMACYKYKCNLLNKNNIIMMLFSGFFIAICYIGINSLLYYFIFNFLLTESYALTDINNIMQILSYIIPIVLTAIISILIFLLLKIFSLNYRGNISYFEFNTQNNRFIYATLYTLIFYALNLILLAPSFYILGINKGFFYQLLFMGGIIINILFVYFSVRNCFTQVFPTLQLKRLFKSYAIVFLLLSLFLLLFGLSFILLEEINIPVFYNYNQEMPSLVTSLLWIIGISSYVVVFFANRFAIKRYFSS